MKFEFDYRPSDSPLVEMVWRTQSEGTGSFISQAETRWEMVVTRQRDQTTISLRGPETMASLALIPQDADFMGIIFKPGTFMPHLPAEKLVNGGIHLPESTRKGFWLYGSTWELPDFENVDTFINRLVRQELLTVDPVVESVVRDEPLDMSLRTVQRRFKQTTGITYKTFQQIKRARYAAELMKQGMSIIDASYEAGYFDQAHMTNSFKRYIGTSPAQF